MNIGTIIDAAAIGDPDRVALIIGKDAIGYGQLAAAVERCAAGLAANGVAAGARRRRRRRQPTFHRIGARRRHASVLRQR